MSGMDQGEEISSNIGQRDGGGRAQYSAQALSASNIPNSRVSTGQPSLDAELRIRTGDIWQIESLVSQARMRSHARHSLDRRFEMEKCFLLQCSGDLGADTSMNHALMHDDCASSLTDASNHRLTIPGVDGPQIDQLHREAELLLGRARSLRAEIEGRSIRDESDTISAFQNLGFGERKLIGFGRHLLHGSPIQDLGLEEYDGIIRGDGSKQESFSLYRRTRHHDAQAWNMRKERLGRLSMVSDRSVQKFMRKQVGVNDLQGTMSYSAAWHAKDETTKIEPCIALTIAKFGSLIHHLVKGRIHVVGELDLGYRFHALRSGSDGKPCDALLTQRSVEDAFGAIVDRQVHGASEDPAEGNIFAEQEHALVLGQSSAERIVDSLVEVQSLGAGFLSGERKLGIFQSRRGRVVEERGCSEVCRRV